MTGGLREANGAVGQRAARELRDAPLRHVVGKVVEHQVSSVLGE